MSMHHFIKLFLLENSSIYASWVGGKVEYAINKIYYVIEAKARCLILITKSWLLS